MFFRAVGIEEGAADVDDFPAVPAHYEAGAFGYDGDLGGAKVLFFRKGEEFLKVLRLDNYRHSLLGLAYGELGSVKTLVFLRNGIEVDVETVGELADGDGDAARAEVVAALYHAAGFGISEKALELALLRGVALLYLRAAGFKGFGGVGFGGAGGSAAAVASGCSTEEDYDVPGSGTLAADVCRRGGGNNRADFHSLCGVARVIDFVDDARGKTDLVAVGGVAGGGGGDDFALGKLALDGLADGFERVGGAGKAHCSVNVGTTGERVAYCAADAGGGAAEGLDLRRVVVGFVLEEKEPGLFLSVRLNLDFDGAGVDLLGLVELRELSGLFEVSYGEGRYVHKADGLRPPELFSRGDIVVVCALEKLVLELHAVDGGVEGGVAAMVGPVGVDHLDFGDGGLATLGFEVLLAEGAVVRVHGETVAFNESFEPRPVEGGEALKGRYLGGYAVLGGEGLGLFEARFPGFNGVYDVFFDVGDVLFGKVAVKGIDFRRPDCGALPLGDNLDALGGGVGSLVKLTGKVLHGESHGAGKVDFVRDDVQLGLGENGFLRVLEKLLADVFGVVAVDDPDALEIFYPEKGHGVAFKSLCLGGKLVFLFNKNAVYQISFPPLPEVPGRRYHGGKRRCQNGFFPRGNRIFLSLREGSRQRRLRREPARRRLRAFRP